MEKNSKIYVAGHFRIGGFGAVEEFTVERIP